jgi:hypothetical protein
MERHLREQFERLFAEADDRADGEALDNLRTQLTADIAEALDGALGSCATVGGESDAEDLSRAAAHLDGRLTGSEREAFLSSLAASWRQRADLASAAALLADIEAEPKTVPARLLARAGSAFAAGAAHGKSPRPVFTRRNPAVGWSLATLALLVVVPGALVLVGGIYGPFRSKAPSSVDALAPPRLEEAIPRLPAVAPAQSLKPKSDAPAHAPEPADLARSVPDSGSCEAGSEAKTAARRAEFEAGRSAHSRSYAPPCPPPIGAAESGKALDRTGVEDGAAAVHRSVPTPSAILPSTR